MHEYIINSKENWQLIANRLLNLLHLIQYEVVGAQRQAQKLYAISSQGMTMSMFLRDKSSASLVACSCALHVGINTQEACGSSWQEIVEREAQKPLAAGYDTLSGATREKDIFRKGARKHDLML